MPQTGSDGTGLRLIEQLGHRVRPAYPALTPLLQQPPRYADLSGVSRAVTLRAANASGTFTTRGGFLFTHRGFSGPAVLDVSHLAVRARRAGAQQEILVDWADLSADAWNEALQASRGTVASALRLHLENRLAERLLADAEIAAGQRLAELGRGDRRRLVEVLTRWPLPWTADAGYRKAEVTGGGVDLAEVDPRTLESRRRPGLFLCGEILDAFGPIGGYNFAWAWATGRAAGLGAAARGQLAGAGRQRS